MDIVISVVPHLLWKLVDVTMQEASYPFRFNKYARELETEKENLQLRVQGVQDRAKEAKKKTEKVVSDVEKWLLEADSLIAKVVELEENTKKRNKTTCLKYCPNLVKRYSLSKKLEERTIEIKKHCQIEFPEFSRLATLVGMNFFSSQDFLHFDSRHEAYDRLLEALKDKQVRMIGLCGMGGCGKTTLVKQVGREAEQFFDQVVFVVVSKTVDIRNIQGKIASQLDLKLGEEEELDRARRLSMRLSSGERFLIILDDVWEKLDFEAIGIAPENQTGCTTLITTRSIEVCRLMKCERMTLLNVLNEDDAWVLFEKHAGEFDNSDVLKSLAQEITKECGGLPVAIATVASTLKGKSQVEWDEALKTLRDSSPMDIEAGLKDPYTCLRFSYDNLGHEVAKSLFLLCSIFPEDYEILVDELTMIGVGLGLVEEVHSYQRARNQLISKGKNKLIDSCLLLEVDGKNDHVKMHDLVRDVARWIAKKENKWIMRQIKEGAIMKDSIVRCLWFDKVDEFPHKLDCPELEFLHVSTKSEHDVDVTNDIFKGMEKLKILILENTFREVLVLRLPISFHLINNLHCLFLHNWSLGDISFIASLERLVSLKLWDCSFDELSKCISQQKNLRLLDIWECKIQRNPCEVMGRCSQLEVLYFCENKVRDWEGQGKDGAEFFNKISATPALESYCIDFGSNDGAFQRQKFPVTKSLYVKDHENCMSNTTIKDLMQRAEVLYLRRIHRSCTNIIPNLFQTIGGSMHALTQLSLLYSDTIKCVIDTTGYLGEIGVISKLTHLTIKGMKNLKTMCHGQPPPGLFAKLEVLEVFQCNSMEHIITDEMKEIVLDDTEYRRSYGFAFPKLKRLIIRDCNQLEYLMPVSFAESLVQLEILKIEEADKLKRLFGPSIYEDLNPSKFQIVEFSGLRKLTLGDLPNVVSICPENYHPIWPSLKVLFVWNVPQLNIKSINHWIARCGLGQEDDQITREELLKAIVTPLQTLKSLLVVENSEMEVIFDVERLPNNIGQQVNSTLEKLYLEEVAELRQIWRGPKNALLLQHLGQLRIWKCGNLKVIFPASILTSLPQLRQLKITNCKELEEIMEENKNGSNPDQLVFPNLTSISIGQCHKLKSVFPISSTCMLPKLRVLLIYEASQLEQLLLNAISNLKYVILRDLPRFTTMGQWIDLQTARYLVVQNCPRLTFTSTVTPQQLQQILKSEEAYREDIWELKDQLKDIMKSNEDCSRESIELIDSKESEVELESKSEQITSDAQHNEQKSTENAAESKHQSANETNISEEKSVKESFTSKNATIIASSTHSGPTSSLQGSLVTSLPKALSYGTRGSIEGSSTESAKIFTSSALLEPAGSLLGSLVTNLPIEFPQEQIKVSETKVDTEANPVINLQDFEGNVGQLPITSTPVVLTAKDELVGKALADLEVCLKMPLKDLAASEAKSLHLLTVLNFLSRLPCEDGALSHRLEATIQSLLQDFPSILYSLKPAFATINKFPKLIDEAQEKEARLKKQIIVLEKAIQDCEAKLSFVQIQKEKCVAEIIEVKKEFDSVRKEKYEMIENQRKAQQQLIEADYRWSVFCGQFQLSNIDVYAHQMKRSALEDNNETNVDYSRETTNQIQSKEIEVHSASESEHLSSEVSANQSMALIASTNLTKSFSETMPSSEIAVTMPTSSTDSELDNKLFPNEVNEISKNESSLTGQQQLLGQIGITDSEIQERVKSVKEPEDQGSQEENIPKENDVKGSIEGSTSQNAEIVPSSTHSELASSSSLVTSLPKAFSHVVAKAIVDLEVCLKMPFRDIATSEANSLRLLTALNFLSHLSFEDGALSPGLKAIIQCLLQELPSILYSFNLAFAITNKFPNFINEAQDKEVRLEEQISVLEKEIQDCKAKLPSIQEKKKKYVAQIIELKNEFDSVRKEKIDMVEDQIKAQRKLLEADYTWSVLCSQFQLNNIAARNLA